MTRTRPPSDSDERTMLTAWLDWHRATVRSKCEGLSEADAHRALLPESPLMTVAGLVSHLRWVERSWFEFDLLGRPDDGPWSDTDPDAEMRVEDVPLSQLLDEYDAQCEQSRQITAAHDLETRERGERAGSDPVSLRWILAHMIEETARHNGHLDILREMLDGTKGV
jgi:uncharacterized damage-inducible protein DinB